MNIKERFINTMEYGGFKEFIRKLFYLIFYKIQNKKTLNFVKKKPAEFGLYNGICRNENIVISMTTFPPRFKKIGLVIKSILLQRFKPDKIIVYLDGKTTYNDLTEEMKAFQEYGVEYRFHNETLLKCHCKYFFAMKEFPNSVIVTTDDDVILPPDWLKSLIDSYRKYPKAVSARRVHFMRHDAKAFLPYNHWFDQYRTIKEPSHLLLATGVGGVLYPPHCLKEGLLNQNDIKKLSLECDDLWLKCWEVMSGVPVVWAYNNEVALGETEAEHEIALSKLNVNERKNDVVLKNIIDYYGLSLKNFLS